MSVTVRVPAVLRTLTAGTAEVKLEEGTLSEVLAGLEEAHPGFNARLFDESGKLHRHVGIYVADDDVNFLEGLDTPVADGQIVAIIPAVAGG